VAVVGVGLKQEQGVGVGPFQVAAELGVAPAEARGGEPARDIVGRQGKEHHGQEQPVV
jgi:hypothetical protein